VLAATHARHISRGAAAFVTEYADRLGAVSRDGTAFMNVLARYAAPSERGLIISTSRLQHQFSSAVKAAVAPAARKLIATLGL
jgi:hypothetical protein